MDINILILSSGRRVELTNCFKAARDRLGAKGIVAAADCSPLAPTLYFADRAFIVPRISEEERYIESIIKISKENDISLIVPTIDTELILLAREKKRIEAETPAKVLISDSRVINICRDKRKTQEFLENEGFGVPRLLSPEELRDPESLSYPLFIKPIDGSSSIDTHEINSPEELRTYLKVVPKPMVQEYMEGTEFTVDAFLDFESRLISCVPRIRLATRSGEINKGQIRRDREIIEDVKRLMERLSPIGHITVQCRKTDEGIKYIEINPRFGGGAPMSIDAGADSCEYLYRILSGEKLEYNEDYEDGVYFLRFDQAIRVSEQDLVTTHGIE